MSRIRAACVKMGYYIKTQLEYALERKGAKVYALGIFLACLMANLSMTAFRDIIYGMNDGTFAYNLIMFAKGFFWIPYYTMIAVASMAFGDKYPDPRIRDKSTIGLNRTDIFFGKFATALILLGIYVLIATAVFLLITPLFQVHDGTIDAAVILDFVEAVLMALPLFVAGLSIGNMFLFSCRKKEQAYVFFALFVIVLPRIIMLLATDRFNILPFVWISKFLITPQFQTMQFYATRDIPKMVISGALYTALSCAIGCINFNRREFD